MQMSLADAARATGKGKSTLLRAVKSGKLSSQRTEDGVFMVDAAELARVFTVKSPERTDGASRSGVDASDAEGVEVAVLRAKVTLLEAQLSREQEAVDDLRKRLDRAEAERVQILMLQGQGTTRAQDPAKAGGVLTRLRSWLK